MRPDILQHSHLPSRHQEATIPGFRISSDVPLSPQITEYPTLRENLEHLEASTVIRIEPYAEPFRTRILRTARRLGAAALPLQTSWLYSGFGALTFCSIYHQRSVEEAPHQP